MIISILIFLWLACQKKSYLICDEIMNFRIFTQPIAVLVSEYVLTSPHIQCMALSFVLVPRPPHGAADRRPRHARCLGQLALLSRSAFKAV